MFTQTKAQTHAHQTHTRTHTHTDTHTPAPLCLVHMHTCAMSFDYTAVSYCCKNKKSVKTKKALDEKKSTNHAIGCCPSLLYSVVLAVGAVSHLSIGGCGKAGVLKELSVPCSDKQSHNIHILSSFPPVNKNTNIPSHSGLDPCTQDNNGAREFVALPPPLRYYCCLYYFYTRHRSAVTVATLLVLPPMVRCVFVCRYHSCRLPDPRLRYCCTAVRTSVLQ